MRGVLDHGQPVGGCQGVQGVHIRGVAPEMHGKQGFGRGPMAVSTAFGSMLKVSALYVDEHWTRSEVPDHFCT